MKKNIFASLIIAFSSIFLYAIPAKKGQIIVTQPDGSTLTIEVHGDEFLNWRTASGRLITMGEDGYYYNANYDAYGNIVQTATRATGTGYLPTSFSGEFEPHPMAVARANEQREKLEEARNFQRSGYDSGITKGNKKFLTILVEFSDLEFTYTKSDFEQLLNQEGYSHNGATGSAYDYYYENSNNLFDPEFVVVGPIKASKSYSYYGGGDETTTLQELFTEVVGLANESVDFSEYDQDNDGLVDNIFFFYAGHNEAEGASSGTIWPHKWALFDENVVHDGKRIYGYACTSELKGAMGTTMCGIGTFTHEFGHVIGLPDFYDTDYGSNGQAAGLGIFSLMGAGGYNNESNTPPYLSAVEKNMLGWMDGIDELTESGTYTLQSVDKDKAYFTRTRNQNEYFVFESRSGEGWDKYIPTGMLIYHINNTDRDISGLPAYARWDFWKGINDHSHAQCYNLIESCGEEKFINRTSTNVPFPGSRLVTEFTDKTTPAFVDLDGKTTSMGLTNIQDNKSNGVSFELTVLTKEAVNFKGKVIGVDAKPLEGAQLEIKYADKIEQTKTNSLGEFTLPAYLGYELAVEIMMPDYQTLQTNLVFENSENSAEFTLSQSPFVGYGFNYIKLSKSEFKRWEFINLELSTLEVDPISVRWFFNGYEVDPAKSLELNEVGEHTIKVLIETSTGLESITQKVLVTL